MQMGFACSRFTLTVLIIQGACFFKHLWRYFAVSPFYGANPHAIVLVLKWLIFAFWKHIYLYQQWAVNYLKKKFVIVGYACEAWRISKATTNLYLMEIGGGKADRHGHSKDVLTRLLELGVMNTYTGSRHFISQHRTGMTSHQVLANIPKRISECLWTCRKCQGDALSSNMTLFVVSRWEM